MQVRDVIAAVDRWAPRELAYDWDKVGLSTGRPDAKVTKILVALTITSDVLKAAVAAKSGGTSATASPNSWPVPRFSWRLWHQPVPSPSMMSLGVSPPRMALGNERKDG